MDSLATCHEPHVEFAYYPFYLRRSNKQSILCLECHDKEVGGPHRDAVIRNPKGGCANCHIPYKAKSEKKIWAINLKGEFDGVHDLCYNCHNPHMQSDSGGGYHLRSKGEYVGFLGSREDFCNQCHEGAHKDTSFENIECLTCHHPHKGSTRIDEDPDIGRLILIGR